jgi:EpsI family protein
MTATHLSTLPETSSVAPARAPIGARLGLWVRVAIACGILLASGFIRSQQAVRIQSAIAAGLNDSFPLEELPMTLGPWQGEPTQIDEKIARGTGATQVVTRRYINQDTGVPVDVILLFGQAVGMYIHTPELCYPSAGFTLAGGPDARTIPTPSGAAPFRALVYSKGEGTAAQLQEVYYAWRYNGRWSPEVGKQKHFERISGMYKVHVARHVTENERRDVGNPCEAFLRVLLPEMERRMATPAARPPHT